MLDDVNNNIIEGGGSSNKKEKEVDKTFVFEDDVFFYEQRSDYVVKNPIKAGFFNMNHGKETIQTVICDLERLTMYILLEKLKIKRQDFQHYSIILIVPDIFQRL